MDNEKTLSFADRTLLDALTTDAVALCRGMGITNDDLIASAVSDIVIDDLAARARVGYPQARCLLRHLLVGTVAGWIEEEEAAGRPVHSTTDAVRRIIENASRQPRQQA